MAKLKTKEAQERLALKRGAARLEREGLANLGTAAVATRTGAIFFDLDFTIGLMVLAASLPAAKKKSLAEDGREIRLSLLPQISEISTAVDLVARLPADLVDLSEIARQLLSLGLRSNRKRGFNFAEFTGSSDEAAVRAVVEPLGGCVTAIGTPQSAGAATGASGDDPDLSPSTIQISDASTEETVQLALHADEMLVEICDAPTPTTDHEMTDPEIATAVDPLGGLVADGADPTAWFESSAVPDHPFSPPRPRPLPSVRPFHSEHRRPAHDQANAPKEPPFVAESVD